MKCIPNMHNMWFSTPDLISGFEAWDNGPFPMIFQTCINLLLTTHGSVSSLLLTYYFLVMAVAGFSSPLFLYVTYYSCFLQLWVRV